MADSSGSCGDLFGALHRATSFISSGPDPGLDGASCHLRLSVPGRLPGCFWGALPARHFALTCILTFVFIGGGTPAPFDPPRRLVVQGPYRTHPGIQCTFGAGLALAGAALFYQSIPLLGYAGLFLAITHLFVVLCKEPTLRRSLAGDYEAYCRRVGRWWPKQLWRHSRSS